MDDEIRRALAAPSTSVVIAGKALNLSRNTAYKAFRNGEIEGEKIGGKIIVPTAPLRRRLGLDHLSENSPTRTEQDAA